MRALCLGFAPSLRSHDLCLRLRVPLAAAKALGQCTGMDVVLVGCGPWPLEPGAVPIGPAIRLRQFFEPLRGAGHRVAVVLLEGDARGNVPIPGAAIAFALGAADFGDPFVIEKGLGGFRPRAVFGVGSIMPAAVAARLAEHFDCACWVDHFGDPMAELHAAQSRADSVDIGARDHHWRLFLESLARGDAFSAVSGSQRHALMGQLGLLGRYVADADVCRRLHVIPCGVPEDWLDPVEPPPFPQELADRGIAPGTPFVYFGGSWNVWLDEVAMARALSIVLDREPAVRVVCAGIAVGASGQQVRARFLAELGHADRVVELPPLPVDVELAVLAHARACLMLNRCIPEAELGSRNRLLAMARAGTLVVVSGDTEIERQLPGIVVDTGGKVPHAAMALLDAVNGRRSVNAATDGARCSYVANVAFAATMHRALAWLEAGAPRWPAPPTPGLVDAWARMKPEQVAAAGDGAMQAKPRKWSLFPWS